MKKINFDDMAVFERLENEAIDGVIDYNDFPPTEYKYFSKLTRLGYNNRHKGWDIDICLEKQEEYRTDYGEEKAKELECYAWARKLNDNRIKAQEFKAKMYKAKCKDEMLDFAIKIIEKLLDENGFEERMKKKLFLMESEKNENQ